MAASIPAPQGALLALPIRLRLKQGEDNSPSTASSTAVASKPKPASAFLGMPAELRVQIYGHAFTGQKAYVVYGKGWLCVQDFYPKQIVPFPQLAALLRTNKLVHEEALPVLYGKVEFIFEWEKWLDFPVGPFLPKGPRMRLSGFNNVDHLRHVTLEFKGRQILYASKNDDFAADTVALLSQLKFGENVQKLGIVFQDNMDYHNITGLERAASLMHVVKCRGPDVEMMVCRAHSEARYDTDDHEKLYEGQEYRWLLENLQAYVLHQLCQEHAFPRLT